MPALPSVSKVVQLAFGTTNTGDTHVDINRLHFSYSGVAPTPAQMVSFATTCLTAFASALAPQMSSQHHVVSVDAIDLSSPTAATAEVSATTDGALTGGTIPDSLAVVMSATVARRYRGGHPRSYLVLGDDTKLDSTRSWDSGWLATVLTAWEGFIAAVEGAGWTAAGTILPVNVSYYQGFTNFTPAGKRAYSVPTLRVGGPITDAITGYVPRAKVGTQRRRLGK